MNVSKFLTSSRAQKHMLITYGAAIVIFAACYGLIYLWPTFAFVLFGSYCAILGGFVADKITPQLAPDEFSTTRDGWVERSAMWQRRAEIAEDKLNRLHSERWLD